MPEYKYFLEGKQTSLPEMYELVLKEMDDIVSMSSFFRRVQMSGVNSFTKESLYQILNRDYTYLTKKEFFFNGEVTPIKTIYNIFKEEYESRKEPYCSYPTFHRKIYSYDKKSLTMEDSFLVKPNYKFRNTVPKQGIREKEAMTAQGIKFWCDTAKLW